MSSMAQTTTGRWLMGAIASVAMPVLFGGWLWAAQSPAVQTGTSHPSPAAASVPGVVLDRLVAVVNDDVILESDVDEERRFEEIQPYRRNAAEGSRDKTIERLIDRALILQQSALEPEDAVSDKELDDQLLTLRKDIPDCKKQFQCSTDE